MSTWLGYGVQLLCQILDVALMAFCRRDIYSQLTRLPTIMLVGLIQSAEGFLPQDCNTEILPEIPACWPAYDFRFAKSPHCVSQFLKINQSPLNPMCVCILILSLLLSLLVQSFWRALNDIWQFKGGNITMPL